METQLKIFIKPFEITGRMVQICEAQVKATVK
jgi:hypothetical protein